MRKFSIKHGLVRIADKIDKLTFIDWILHVFGIHVIRKSTHTNKSYCRLCSKSFNLL